MEGGTAQRQPPKYSPECASLNGRSISVTTWNHSTSVFKRLGLLILFFFMTSFNFIIKYLCIFRLVLRCLLVSRKVNLTGVSTDLTGWSKNLVKDPTGAGWPDRFPSLLADPKCWFIFNLFWNFVREWIKRRKIDSCLVKTLVFVIDHKYQNIINTNQHRLHLLGTEKLLLF